ncbi:MAG: sigma 54-interacting transcriptional regulator [Saprospiraceae bacterium]|nr:sigma 54-interacting transcriptional regulator [Saprospiraceae bacterium]
MGRHLRQSIEKTELKAENTQLKQELTQVKEQYEYNNPPEIPLIGNSAKMERLRKMLKIMADDKDTTVLITGETGVGKGVAARFLHYNSLTRRDQPFEEIHISNISKSLLESQLFGAKKVVIPTPKKM